MLLFELIQVAVGRRDKLTCIPSKEEWQRLYTESMKQAVVGITLAGLERLMVIDSQLMANLPIELKLEWIGVGEQIRATNEMVNKRCCKLQSMLSEAGIRSSILKGQAVASYYGDSLAQYRQSGDIDIYVDCGLEEALKFAKAKELNYVDWDYKHLHLEVFKNTEVEMHYRVEILLNLWKNKSLQKWFKEHTETIYGSRIKVQGGEIVTPIVEFNMFYILLHIYRHFLYEGVGLRQLMDYYYVLCHTVIIDTTEVVKTLEEFGLMRFAQGIMWVMQEVFAMDSQHMICKPLESEGKVILAEVMAGGNFGHYDERKAIKRSGKLFTVVNIVKHNVHLIRHYPADVLWSPIWFVWHKLWKVRMKSRLKGEGLMDKDNGFL